MRANLSRRAFLALAAGVATFGPLARPSSAGAIKATIKPMKIGIVGSDELRKYLSSAQ